MIRMFNSWNPNTGMLCDSWRNLAFNDSVFLSCDEAHRHYKMVCTFTSCSMETWHTFWFLATYQVQRCRFTCLILPNHYHEHIKLMHLMKRQQQQQHFQPALYVVQQHDSCIHYFCRYNGAINLFGCYIRAKRKFQTEKL